MYKKAVFLIAVLTVIASISKSYGQQIGNGFLGIRAGVNYTKVTGDLESMDVGVKDMELSVKMKPGFQLGLVVNYPMNNDNWEFQTGLLYSQQGAKWEGSSSETYLGVKIEYAVDIEMALNYLNIPANFIYRHELNNGGIVLLQAGPYLGYGVGGKMKIDISAKANASGVNISEKESNETTIKFGDDSNKNQLKTFDLGLGLGVGLLFKEKVHLGVGYNFGLSDIGHHEVVKNAGASATLTIMFGR